MALFELSAEAALDRAFLMELFDEEQLAALDRVVEIDRSSLRASSGMAKLRVY